MLKATQPSCKTFPFIRCTAPTLLAVSALLLMFSADTLASADQQLSSSWNTSPDLISAVLTTPRSFQSSVTIYCPPCRCSPNSTVLAVTPKLSLIEWLHRLHTWLYGVESFIHLCPPRFRLRKFTKSFHSAVRKFLHQPTPPLPCFGFPEQLSK